MAFEIPIRRLLALRQQHDDRALMDFLDLTVLARETKAVATEVLKARWGCHQATVSRRMKAVKATGLCRIRSSNGAYRFELLERESG